ncbi:MAG TPA: hypothetical protein VF047_06285 [Nitrososphaeraceae archaeon]
MWAGGLSTQSTVALTIKPLFPTPTTSHGLGSTLRFESDRRIEPWTNSTTHKPKMFNSFELLTGSIQDIQRKHEILSDIVSEYNRKVHGSQRGHDPKTGQLSDLLVYYEVPAEGNNKREEVKQKFNNFIARNNIVLQRNY